MPAMNVRAVAFDLDGTLYVGERVLPGAVEVVGWCRRRGLRVLYLTNSTVRTRQQIADKLAAMGFPVAIEDVYCCSNAAARFARESGYWHVYVIGARALRAEMTAQGVPLTEEIAAADALFVGHDPEWHLELFGGYTLAPDAAFIACNRDMTYPGGDGRRLPGCGVVVARVERAVGRRADVVVGKPATYLLELIERDLGFAAADVLVVGDMEESDIAMARRAGAPAALLAGESAVEVEGAIVIESLAKLEELL
jgi:arabinose operon protein AraL